MTVTLLETKEKANTKNGRRKYDTLYTEDNDTNDG